MKENLHQEDILSEAEVRRLVQEAQCGSRHAFDDLVAAYRGLIYNIAWQSTRNTDDALDLTQEIFIRVFKALKSYHGNSKFTTWLHRIALNVCVDHNRTMKRYQQTMSIDELDEKQFGVLTVPIHTTNQRDRVYQNQIKKRIIESLELLSARQKEVFILRYYHDLDLKRIAEVTKCSESSVKSHLLRAQLRLRELLGGLDY